ncbi:choline BCCT transporter BetT [Alteromonas halophila]|uniref:High-affinity choline transporter BetT n=1 Tax=Alteromonas halophila TaxID=516698 RepID=A0A918JPD7_9ALTE|nr:choline BCCT transporter BetT [Alteromonas halophila]GGW91108.1 high-affinity choline transporter BetT [Alteromonas halophila]
MSDDKDKQERGGGDDKVRVNPIPFYGSVIGITIFALWAILFTEAASSVIGQVLTWISSTFGWFYFTVVVAYLVFVIVIALSPWGKVRLGQDHSRPEFNVVTWAAMLFAAGIGIDLIFFCIVEPITQFMAPPVDAGEGAEAARNAIKLTLFHWGVSGWGVYTLVGMSLAYFSYRHGLPLAIRSALYPLIGKRIYGPVGHTVDIAAVLGTVFGLATSLGIGLIQLNYGLNHVFGVPEGLLTQVILAAVVIVFAAISAVTGVDKGIRRLSEFNMLLALLLMLFVLFVGETRFLLNALVLNVGDYISGFIDMSFNTYAFDQPTDWLNAWTLFFWAWWIAWGPFVGLFLARISRGRTIAEFVAGTLILPLTFMMVWMSIMGNSAIDMVMGGAQEFGQQAMDNPGSAIYMFLEEIPWAGLTTIVVSILAFIFFITSGDSGSLVLSNLTSILKDPYSDAPSWMRIMWAAIIGLLTIALLLANGLTALQSAVVITGLPFAIVLCVMMVGVVKALRLEGLKQRSIDANLPIHPHAGESSKSWTERLQRAMSFPDEKECQQFLDDTAKPAMEAVKSELEARELKVQLIDRNDDDDEFMALSVDLQSAQDFYYELRPSQHLLPSFATGSVKGKTRYYRVEVMLVEGGQGYDLMGYTKDQVIADILEHFERHMHFLHAQREQPGANVELFKPQNQ